MSQPATRALISAAIKSAPAFARLGLSMRDARYRDRAADALALAIAERLRQPVEGDDDGQLGLPL